MYTAKSNDGKFEARATHTEGAAMTRVEMRNLHRSSKWTTFTCVRSDEVAANEVNGLIARYEAAQ